MVPTEHLILRAGDANQIKYPLPLVAPSGDLNPPHMQRASPRLPGCAAHAERIKPEMVLSGTCELQAVQEAMGEDVLLHVLCTGQGAGRDGGENSRKRPPFHGPKP